MVRGGRKDLEALFQEIVSSGWIFVGLIVATGIGVWIVIWIRSRLADDEGSSAEDHRLLSQIADLKEQGDLTEEEYRSIKGRLAKRIDNALSVPGGDQPARQASRTSESTDSDNPEINEKASRPRDEAGN